jgi:hypothetical protein
MFVCLTRVGLSVSGSRVVGWDGMHCWTSLLQAWSLWCCVVGFLFLIYRLSDWICLFLLFFPFFSLKCDEGRLR